MMPIHMVVAYLRAQLDELRRDNSTDGERGAGDVVTMVVMISLFVAAALAICGILILKARTAANNVQTQ